MRLTGCCCATVNAWVCRKGIRKLSAGLCTQQPFPLSADMSFVLQILFKVSGVMRPGEMLALMGPSGSGKTSLLSIISGRAPRAVTTSGKITSNGEKFTKAAKRRVGFVLQDDLLYEVRDCAAGKAACRHCGPSPQSCKVKVA